MHPDAVTQGPWQLDGTHQKPSWSSFFRRQAEETACIVDGHRAQGMMFPGYVGSLTKYMKSRSSKYKDLVIQGFVYKLV